MLQVVVSCAHHFFLEESILTVEVLKHLFVDLVSNVTLVHHNDILHAIFIIFRCIVVANLRDQLEQQLGALFIINFWLFTKLFQNDFFRIISIEIDGFTLNALSILHILQILQKKLILDRHMGEFSHIEVEIQEYIFFDACVSNFDARDWDEFTDDGAMGFFCLVQQPRSQR